MSERGQHAAGLALLVSAHRNACPCVAPGLCRLALCVVRTSLCVVLGLGVAAAGHFGLVWVVARAGEGQDVGGVLGKISNVTARLGVPQHETHAQPLQARGAHPQACLPSLGALQVHLAGRVCGHGWWRSDTC